jgi:hypothetical protein
MSNGDKAPAFLFFVAFLMVTANNGPGIRTPDKEISITEARNK